MSEAAKDVPAQGAEVGEVAAQASAELFSSIAVLMKDPTQGLTLSSGRKIEVRVAKMKHIGILIQFFQTLISRLNQEEIALLIEQVSKAQQKMVDQGASPLEINLQSLAVVEKALASVNLLAKIFNMVVDTLPMLAETFTDLSQAEFGDLDPDDGLMVPVSIFAVNYSFFIRRLLPALGASFLVAIQVRKSLAKDASASKS